MMSPEKSPIVIRKYTRSPDLVRRFDSHLKLRSPDQRMRSLDGISSLPELKEGSAETSADNSQTPERSPERDILRDLVHHEDEEEEEEEDDDVATLLEGSPRSFSSVKISLSQEGSPDSKTTSQGLIVSDGLEMQPSSTTTFKKEISPQGDWSLESSYETSSKFPEEPLDVQYSECLAAEGSHSKSASNDARGKDDSNSPNPSSSPRLSASTTNHFKAASDDITVFSSIMKPVAVGSMAGSRSMTGIDHVGTRTSEGLCLLKDSSLPVAERSNGQLSRGNAEDLTEGGQSIEFSSDSFLEDTTISPTLRIMQKSKEVDGEQGSVDEEALFDMLRRREAEEPLAGEEGRISGTGAFAIPTEPVLEEKAGEAVKKPLVVECERTLDSVEEKSVISSSKLRAVEAEPVLDSTLSVNVSEPWDTSSKGRAEQGAAEVTSLQPLKEHRDDDCIQTGGDVKEGHYEERTSEEREEERVVEEHITEGKDTSSIDDDRSSDETLAEGTYIDEDKDRKEQQDGLDTQVDRLGVILPGYQRTTCDLPVTADEKADQFQESHGRDSSYDTVMPDMLSKDSSGADQTLDHSNRNDPSVHGITQNGVAYTSHTIDKTRPAMEGQLSGLGRGSHDLGDGTLLHGDGDNERTPDKELADVRSGSLEGDEYQGQQASVGLDHERYV